jgi:hypothetical protein
VPIICKTLSRKYPTLKRTGGVAQVVEHLPSKHKAQSSNPSTNKQTNKQKKTKKKERKKKNEKKR